MASLTIRLPEDKHERLRALAQRRKMSVNRLVDELATAALANHDAHARFLTRRKRGSSAKAIKLLEGLGSR